MVKKLRNKFIITAMSSLLVVLILIFGVINVVNVIQISLDADETLSTLAENDGMFPNAFGQNNQSMEFPGNAPGAGNSSGEGNSGIPPEPQDNAPNERDRFKPDSEYIKNMELPYSTRYFLVKLNSQKSVTEINTGHVAAVSSNDASEYALEVISGNYSKNSFISTYRYHVKENDDGSFLIIFLDCSQPILSAKKLFIQTLIIGAISLIGMFILVYAFSGRAISPVVESLEKQKRFITDAGHELKTPLAVISANIDVLEIESGKSEWTKSIRNQIKRLNDLIKNMLTLARMDEENVHPVFTDFDMSKAIKTCAESFEAVAESKNKKYNIHIEDNITLFGDQNSINQLASLLIDNAMKYSSEKGYINVSLRKEKNIIFEVSNSCDSMPSGNLDRLFDRFYRADASRNRETGGYGIGLSVAKTIVQSHGGNIEAKKDGDKSIRFVATFPNKKIKQ
ncbi:MAG: HAMP domain-containing histidine kinase [Butyrivibrio sp.]|nr:HAMP domain-containing histidine kinase [Butyrivibrio sp.]